MRNVELGRAVRDRIRESGLTQKEMAKVLGTSQASLSDWIKHGVPEAKATEVAQELGLAIPEDFRCEVEYVPVREASRRLGMGERLLQLALQQGKFDFGMAVKGTEKAYKYYIFRQPFEEFMEKVKKPQKEAHNEILTKEIIP